MALARLGGGDEVAEVYHLLNPINHTRTAADVERYKGGAIRARRETCMRGRRTPAAPAERITRVGRVDLPGGSRSCWPATAGQHVQH